MSITIKNLANIEPYQGDHAISGIRFFGLRQALGVRAWGMNLLEFAPNTDGYPEHDHEEDGQEEVYFVLEGSLILICEGSERVLARGDLVKVPPGVRRKFVTQSTSAKLLALGGTPGKAYSPPPTM